MRSWFFNEEPHQAGGECYRTRSELEFVQGGSGAQGEVWEIARKSEVFQQDTGVVPARRQ